MTALAKNQLHTVTITGYTAEGSGVARVNGQVVFVHGGVRGEVCTVRILKVLKNAAFARVEDVLERSPARREPDCPHYPACGGCDFRHISYEEELEAKRRRIEDALRRIGGVDLTLEGIMGAASDSRYRNKVQFPVQPGGRGPKIGFFRARSHAVVDVPDCLLQPPAAANLRRAVREWMLRRGIQAYDERGHKGLVRHICVRTNQAGQSLCCLVVNAFVDRPLPLEEELIALLRAAEPGLVGVALSANSARTNVVLGRELRVLWGQDFLDETLCGLSFRLSIPSFFQVNREQAERLYEKAVEFAGLTGQETVLDLYCGTGTITLVMARRAMRAVGVEVTPEAVANAEENARRNGVENARFFLGDAGTIAARLAGENLRPHVVVVDPPRKGLEAGVISAVAEMGPERVVYVSCDPGTLARDVGRFMEAGYAPGRAAAVDMFPRTRHVETVVLLTNQKSTTKQLKRV